MLRGPNIAAAASADHIGGIVLTWPSGEGQKQCPLQLA